jgi:hypothetical protein
MGKRSLAALASFALIAGWVLHDNLRSDLPEIEPVTSADETAGGPLPPIRSLGGGPIGEPPPAPPLYTNESLQKDLEKQKKAMGIKRIIAPREEESAPSSTLAERSDRVISELSQRMQLQASPQALIQGSTPRIDSSQETTSKAGPLSVVTPYAGAVISKAEDAETSWAEAGLGQPRPPVDFSKDALIIAPGPISAIHERAGHVVVDYRKDGPQAARYAIMPKTNLPVVFERLP